MTETLALDTSAVVDFLRPDRVDPPPIKSAQNLVIPLTVFGELLAGAYSSDRSAENIAVIEDFVASRRTLMPDADSARIYGRLRADLHADVVRPRKVNDLWIAALCIQHDVPLLTNDRGFDSVRGLTVIHW